MLKLTLCPLKWKLIVKRVQRNLGNKSFGTVTVEETKIFVQFLQWRSVLLTLVGPLTGPAF